MEKIFISWSGESSYQVASALKDLLVFIFSCNDDDIFVSKDMEKGVLWPSLLVQNLQNSVVGIICLTPERLNSPWLHFEAGALSNQLTKKEPDANDVSNTKDASNAATDQSRIYTYLHRVKPAELTGPLAFYQSTTTTKKDTKLLILDLMGHLNVELEIEEVSKKFDERWREYNRALKKSEISLLQLIPDFEGWFQRKTFDEPLPQCTGQSWLNRYNGARETYLKIKQNKVLVERACPMYLVDLYEDLQTAMDAYVMNLELLLRAEPFPINNKGEVDIPYGIVRACENRRVKIKNIVSTILDPKQKAKTNEAVRFDRNETFAQKKLLVHRKEFEIERYLKERSDPSKTEKNEEMEEMIIPEDINEYVVSNWDLDRIYYYILNEKLNEQVDFETAVEAIYRELEKVRSKEGAPSLMPLAYSLRLLLKMVSKKPGSLELPGSIKEVLQETEEYIDEDPEHRDKGQQIRKRIKEIRKRLVGQTD